MIEMKPCPFCGGKPEINRCVDMPDGVSLGAQVVCFNPLCPAHVGATGHTEAEAITAWNTRQNISDVLIEALEPFAEAWDEAQQWKDFDGQDCRPQYLINAVDTGDFERAAAALRQAKGGEG